MKVHTVVCPPSRVFVENNSSSLCGRNVDAVSVTPARDSIQEVLKRSQVIGAICALTDPCPNADVIGIFCMSYNRIQDSIELLGESRQVDGEE
jgi:hypothetical protein